MLKALISSIPHVGSAISVALFDRLQEKRIKRLETFIEEFRRHIKKALSDPEIVNAIIHELENNEKFIVFTQKCFWKITEEYEKEKFEAYRKAFIRGFLDIKIGIDFKLAVLDILNSCNVVDLRALGILTGVGKNKFTYAKDIIDKLGHETDSDKYIILSSIDTLANLQLIEVGKVELDKGGSLHREEFSYRLTSLGREFANYVFEEL